VGSENGYFLNRVNAITIMIVFNSLSQIVSNGSLGAMYTFFSSTFDLLQAFA